MKVLYISILASNEAIEEASKRMPDFSGYAVQKFNRLVAEGFAQNGHSVTALSTFYQPSKFLFWHRKSEIENRIHYKYVSSPAWGSLRHIWIVMFVFFKVLFWSFFKRNEKVLVCDVLNISSCIGALAAAQITGIKRVGIMTDMPGLMVNRATKRKSTKRELFNAKINKSFLGIFTHYVFLTEQMNGVVNNRRRPYIIMEGLVDGYLIGQDQIYEEKGEKRVVMYAGGLHERYGLKLLVEGFIKADVENSELWLFGDGPFMDELRQYTKNDCRIQYKGIRPNNEVVAAEHLATLLVNPRPTNEEFTKYSFPSKNVEYMASGTPLLTTILPGMPTEYYPYVYLFNEGETEEGYANVLRNVLTLSESELARKGMEAKRWVLMNKNNIRQTARIIELIKRTHCCPVKIVNGRETHSY